MDAVTAVREKLSEHTDAAYRDFNHRLIPTLPREAVLGVRTPDLRRIAKELPPDVAEEFLSALPHRTLEENQIHAFLIERIGEFEKTWSALLTFLPYVDNWATCDQMNPRVFARHVVEILHRLPPLLADPHPYTVRYAIGLLMRYALGTSAVPDAHAMVVSVTHPDYYVRMMQAWYFATALAKDWDVTLPLLREEKLSPWVWDKTVSKACESYRVSPEHKQLLRALRAERQGRV